MNRFLTFILLALSFLNSPSLAQDSTSAAVIAQRQEAEEKYRRMSTDVESVLAANVALQKKVSGLEAEIQRLREEVSRNSNNNNTTETVRKLADAVQEVDRKREADKQVILKTIGDLAKTISSQPRRTESRPSAAPDVSSTPDKGYPYTIQANDTLSAVVADFNSQFKSKGMKTVTQKQVMDANPSVNWNKLKIGQKIFIPAPPEN